MLVGTGQVTLSSSGQPLITYSLLPSNLAAGTVKKAYIGANPLYYDKNGSVTLGGGQLPITVGSTSVPVTGPNPVPDTWYFYIHF